MKLFSFEQKSDPKIMERFYEQSRIINELKIEIIKLRYELKTPAKYKVGQKIKIKCQYGVILERDTVNNPYALICNYRYYVEICGTGKWFFEEELKNK